VRFVVRDGDGGVSAFRDREVEVVAVNDDPVLTASGAVGYTLNGPSVLLMPTATLSDPDSLNLRDGRLVLRYAAGVSASNRLFVGGDFSFSGQTLRFNGIDIGERNADGGIGITELRITFNVNATRAIVQQLLRSIRFRTFDSGWTAQRVFDVFLTDGDGGESNTLTRRVNVAS
jgi:hypothetical protein